MEHGVCILRAKFVAVSMLIQWDDVSNLFIYSGNGGRYCLLKWYMNTIVTVEEYSSPSKNQF